MSVHLEVTPLFADCLDPIFPRRDMMASTVTLGGGTGMTTQPADEDTLIQAARAERGQHRSGASMFGMLGVAVAFGVVGGLLIFLPHLVSMLLPGPLRLLGG